MDKSDRDLILEFKSRLPDHVAAHVRKVIAYGSRVRGHGQEESDLDLLILVDTKVPGLESTIEDIAYKIMWDYDFKPIISIKVVTEAGYRHFLMEGFSFYKNIEREGMPL